jgi:hypothetical protein
MQRNELQFLTPYTFFPLSNNTIQEHGQPIGQSSDSLLGCTKQGGWSSNAFKVVFRRCSVQTSAGTQSTLIKAIPPPDPFLFSRHYHSVLFEGMSVVDLIYNYYIWLLSAVWRIFDVHYVTGIALLFTFVVIILTFYYFCFNVSGRV